MTITELGSHTSCLNECQSASQGVAARAYMCRKRAGNCRGKKTVHSRVMHEAMKEAMPNINHSLTAKR